MQGVAGKEMQGVAGGPGSIGNSVRVEVRPQSAIVTMAGDLL